MRKCHARRSPVVDPLFVILKSYGAIVSEEFKLVGYSVRAEVIPALTVFTDEYTCEFVVTAGLHQF